MVEDKLTQEQRIRLEALAQAIAFINVARMDMAPSGVIRVAQIFTKFLRGDEVKDG